MKMVIVSKVAKNLLMASHSKIKKPCSIHYISLILFTLGRQFNSENILTTKNETRLSIYIWITNYYIVSDVGLVN